jgi:hypothetical protein
MTDINTRASADASFESGLAAQYFKLEAGRDIPAPPAIGQDQALYFWSVEAKREIEVAVGLHGEGIFRAALSIERLMLTLRTAQRGGGGR